MIKKISVFALLFSFLLALGVPVQAKAEEETNNEYGLYFDRDKYLFYDDVGNQYDIISSSAKEKLADNSYYCVVTFGNESGSSYNDIFIYFIPVEYGLACNETLFILLNDGEIVKESVTVYRSKYEWRGSFDTLKHLYSENYNTTLLNNIYYYSHSSPPLTCVYSDCDIYNSYKENSNYYIDLYGDLFYKVFLPYDFESWCADAGLNCSASSNESDSVIPFWYEPDNYNYIVRKTLTASSTSGVYQMTMLQKTDGAHYPYYFEVNDIGYLGVAGAFSDISTFTVRNFYYDAVGNGWKLIGRFDVSTLPFDNTNVTFDENVVFIYSDTDIYANREASSIWQAASTEYYNVDIPEPDTPTPTPTSVPSSGAGRPGSGTRPDTGDEATGGGGLDFIINLFTLIWQKICSIPMAVDGYSISLQQIFVYGALVSIVGGFIIKFIFRR